MELLPQQDAQLLDEPLLWALAQEYQSHVDILSLCERSRLAYVNALSSVALDEVCQFATTVGGEAFFCGLPHLLWTVGDACIKPLAPDVNADPHLVRIIEAVDAPLAQALHDDPRLKANFDSALHGAFSAPQRQQMQAFVVSRSGQDFLRCTAGLLSRALPLPLADAFSAALDSFAAALSAHTLAAQNIGQAVAAPSASLSDVIGLL